MRGFNHLFANVLAGQSAASAVVNDASAVVNAASAVVNAATAVTPGVIPTAPGPGDVFKEGGQCTFSWTPDPSGLWKDTAVQLMSGDNWNMIPITTVATFDGTDATLTSQSFPCPEVTPNSAIYFYQFSTSAAPTNLTWTTRWTLAAADGSTTAPANTTQPNGDKIPWGVGALVDPSKAVPPPSYLTSQSSSTSSSSAPTSSSSSSSSVAISPSSSSSAPSGSSSSTSSAPTTSSHSSASTTATTGSTTSSSASSPTGTNGALSVHGNWAVGALVMGVTAAIFGLM